MATKKSKSSKSKSAKPRKARSPEVRGAKLLTMVRSVIPGAGFVKADPDAAGRKVFFEWHKVDYVLSSRLHVQECGFGRANSLRSETDETRSLTERFKAAAVA